MSQFSRHALSKGAGDSKFFQSRELMGKRRNDVTDGVNALNQYAAWGMGGRLRVLFVTFEREFVGRRRHPPAD
jgi:hypothetical protein